MLRRLARATLRTAGLQLRRIDRTPPGEPARMFDDPLEALHYARSGVPASFDCPLELVRDTKGFAFAGDGWHPWVAEIRHQRQHGYLGYAGSFLERYYRRFRPRTALEALAGFEAPDHCGLAELPSHLFWITPWWAGSVPDLDAIVRDWLRRGARQHGIASFDLESDGTPYHGPVSRRLGEAEVRRLHAVAVALEQDGYDRTKGDSLVYLVRRGQDLRVVKFGGGYHRTAAMAALDREFVPARLRPPHAVDVADVDDWPHVRSGLWSRRSALGYVDHLFDFDSAQWAASMGLQPGR